MGFVVDIPTHELSVGSCERFAHILRFNVAICAGAISEAAMSFEGRLLLRRSLGIEIPAVHGRGWPDCPDVARYTVLGETAPQVRLGFTKGNLGFLVYDCQFN